MSDVNAALMVKVLAQIETHPETWNQKAWRCETGMCFAGWACALSGGQWAYDAGHLFGGADVRLPGQEVTLTPDAAAQLLGLRFEDCIDGLFHSANTLDDLYRICADLIDIDETDLRERVAFDIIAGDIGNPVRHIEFEPMPVSEPVTEPSPDPVPEPVPVPA